LASPATLLAVLRATAFAWQQDALNDNAAQVLRLGTELHSRLATMGKHVTTMGSSLRKSVDSYNQMVGTMESRVMVTSRKMVELGVVESTGATIPTVDSAVRPLTHADLLSAELSEATPSRTTVDLSPEGPLARGTKRAG
jgi:DNA recombination protein RmuC